MLLIALWVRSARWHRYLFGDGRHDVFVGQLSASHDLAIVSMRGQMQFCWFSPPVEYDAARSDTYYGFHQFPLNTRSFFEDTSVEIDPRGLRKRPGNFGIRRTLFGYVVIAPHWVAALLAGSLAAALVPSSVPWLARATYTVINKIGTIRIPRQFSLRTLLIVMTIIAVWLGLIVNLS